MFIATTTILEDSTLHSESGLVAQLAGGNKAAFEQIFREMYPALFISIKKLCADDEQAKDIVAEVFLQVWQHREQLAHVRDIRAYLYISARNHAFRLVRNEKAFSEKKAAFRDHYEKEAVTDSLQSIYMAETMRILQEAVNSLPPECRKVITLSLEGLGTNDIARKMGITASAVSNQKSRALKLLKGKLPAMLLLLLLIRSNGGS